ncbi:MAG: hypothetical protein JZD41_09115 [Thermoproteus sp.]|nr:hypothetical protein [Thermoproteus sp.]
MAPLLALAVLGALLGLAMRRVRDRALAALGVVGFFLIAIPALFINGDVVERLVAAALAYAPYWEYIVPLAAFALALLPPRGRGAGRRRAGSRPAPREEYW